MSPINKTPMASRTLTPNEARKNAIMQYRQEVCENCVQLAGYYKDTSPQDAFNFVLRVKNVLGDDFYSNQSAVGTFARLSCKLAHRILFLILIPRRNDD